MKLMCYLPLKNILTTFIWNIILRGRIVDALDVNNKWEIKRFWERLWEENESILENPVLNMNTFPKKETVEPKIYYF